MKKNLFIISIFLIFCIFFYIYKSPQEEIAQKPSIALGDEHISLIVSDSPELRSRGLSSRESLKSDEAMFFVFDFPDKYGIWMKDMLFPIDIIWLDEDFGITYIEENVLPETYPESFFPPEKSLYIIETNAFFAEKNDLSVGDFLKINDFFEK